MNRRRLSFLAGPLVAVATLLLLSCGAEAAPRVRACRHCHGGPRLFNHFDDGFFPPSVYEEPPPAGYPPFLTSPEEEPPLVVEPSVRPQNAPYTQGFVLDVVTPTSDDDKPQRPASGALTRYRQVADQLAQCWRPPSTFDGSSWAQVTLRVSFKRDGSINGVPRIPYSDQGLTEAARSDLRQSLMAALQRCTPLNLSSGLGAAIAGQIFALRFIEQEPHR